jgi:methyl-accepting chemotaxis protein
MLNNLKIKTKLLTLSLIITFSFIIVSIIQTQAIKNLDSLSALDKNIDNLQINILELRKNEKDFLSRNDLKYYDRFLNNINELNEIEMKLKDGFDDFGLDKQEIDNFMKIKNQYSIIFTKIVELKKKIGLTHNEGLYGSLRNSVHLVQEYAKKANNSYLLATVYA